MTGDLEYAQGHSLFQSLISVPRQVGGGQTANGKSYGSLAVPKLLRGNTRPSKHTHMHLPNRNINNFCTYII